ncbi:MAG TPA: hypothetical protein VLG09_04030 [Candidatus Saccharimonadales bacterium]|nr:hypothetical protein [Candidatus Saccharimonadales bacterium]
MTARFRFRDSGATLRTLARARVRDAGGTSRLIQRIRVRDGSGVLRTVFQYFTVTLSTNIVTGSASGAASSGTVTSSSVTSSIVGGVAGYTYAWQYVSGDATITATTPTASNTTFSAPNVPDALGKIANFRLQVTDSASNVIYSEEVEVQLYWADTR